MHFIKHSLRCWGLGEASRAPCRSAEPWGQSRPGHRWRRHPRLSRSGRATAKADPPVGWRVQHGRAASGTVPSHAQEGTEDDDDGRKPPREPPQRRGVATRRRAKTKSQGAGGYRAALGRGSAVRIATARSLFIGEKIISVSIMSKRLCKRRQRRGRAPWEYSLRRREGSGRGDSRGARGSEGKGAATTPRRPWRPACPGARSGRPRDPPPPAPPEALRPGPPLRVRCASTQGDTRGPAETKGPPAIEGDTPPPVLARGRTPPARLGAGPKAKRREEPTASGPRGSLRVLKASLASPRWPCRWTRGTCGR